MENLSKEMEGNIMGNWDSFQREEKERESAITGKHRVVITEVQEGVTGSKSKNPGTPMITVSVRPSGRHFSVKYRIVKGDYFNQRMTSFFDAFPEITFGDFNFLTWVGAEGAAMFKEDDQGYTQVSYFLAPERAVDLPPFEGEKPERQTVTTLNDEDDDELPFY